MPALSERTASAAQECARADLAPRRVLVIDDNRDVADSLACFCKLSTRASAWAYDGAEGLEALESFDAEIIFLDIGFAGHGRL